MVPGEGVLARGVLARRDAEEFWIEANFKTAKGGEIVLFFPAKEQRS
ncbi:hypothetical protein J2T02_001479 [Chitinophaga terrae (ex Kim and Jung 2007)]|nr:hypothetical protein [Chitinophaga terrae (ex Kim and Jung 2007)]